jgi:hypothetical protein
MTATRVFLKPNFASQTDLNFLKRKETNTLKPRNNRRLRGILNGVSLFVGSLASELVNGPVWAP